MKKSIESATLLQISDLHLFNNPEGNLVGLNTHATGATVIKHVEDNLKTYNPELLVITGDISQDYSLGSYLLLKQLLANIPCNITATLGNHDTTENFIQALSKSKVDITNHVFHHANWRIILLNSHWPYHVAGLLAKNELLFLENELNKPDASPTLIFLHHHVLPTGCKWLDNIILQNAEEFLQIIDRKPNIKAVINGHIHQERQTKRNNVDFLSTPSTCWQFDKIEQKFKLDPIMPGYRWFKLYADGTFKTEVVRVDYKAEFIPDLASSGY